MKTTHYDLDPKQAVTLTMHITEALALRELVAHRLGNPIVNRPLHPQMGWEPVDHLRDDIKTLHQDLTAAIREANPEYAKEMGI